MNDLQGKIALITGATSGIGEASAIRFAKAGATVIVTGRNCAKGEQVIQSICDEGGNAVFYELDVVKDESIESVLHKIKERFGKLDILFNNAGVFPVSSPLENMDRIECNEILDVNVSSVMKVIQNCIPLLKESHGVILNNASVAGLQSYSAGQSYMYCGSKAAIIKITQLVAKKYGAEFRTNCICPGVIRSPIYQTFDEERYKSSIPMGRVGEVDDVAAVANFMVSDDAAFLNGCVLTVDGGQSL